METSPSFIQHFLLEMRWHGLVVKVGDTRYKSGEQRGDIFLREVCTGVLDS